MAESLTPQELTASQAADVNLLVSRAFSYIPPHSFFEDFPVWDLRASAEAGTVKSFGIFSDGRLVSHVGARVAEILMGERTVRVGLIGAVATDTAFRGQGLSTQLMRHSIEFLESHGCEWQILWGSEHDFYAKLGFALAGEQARVRIASLARLHSQSVNEFSKITNGMNDAIFASLCSRRTGVQMREADRKWVFAHKTIQWFSIVEPFAFIGFGRGMDMGHIVHEFGGDPRSLNVLLAHISIRDSLAQIIAPASELRTLGFDQDEIILEHLCLARPSVAGQKWDSRLWISGLGAC